MIEGYMKGPEFLRLPPESQQTLVLVRMRYQMALQQKMIQQAAQQAQINDMLTPEGAAPKGGPGPPSEPATPGPASARGNAPNTGARYPGGLTASTT